MVAPKVRAELEVLVRLYPSAPNSAVILCFDGDCDVLVYSGRVSSDSRWEYLEGMALAHVESHHPDVELAAVGVRRTVHGTKLDEVVMARRYRRHDGIEARRRRRR